MISMFKAYSIRQLRMEGDSIVEISRKLEVSRDTVYKYLAMEDLSQSESTPIPLTPFTPLHGLGLFYDIRNRANERTAAHIQRAICCRGTNADAWYCNAAR